jgi:hypothetical protein
MQTYLIDFPAKHCSSGKLDIQGTDYLIGGESFDVKAVVKDQPQPL